MAIQNLSQASVLVIEDDAVFRLQLTCFLKKQGALVAEAENGKLGLALVEDFQPDIVLCDLRMPELDGQEVIASLVETHPDLPIIVISGNGNMADVAQALRNGARDYLVKPLANWKALELTIMEILNGSITHEPGPHVSDDRQLAHNELAQHVSFFKTDDPASTLLMRNLMPKEKSNINGFHLEFNTTGHDGLLPDVYGLGEDKLVVIVMDLSLLGSEAAITGLLIKSLINEPFRHFQSARSELMIKPAKLLSILNQQLYNARIEQVVKMQIMLFDRLDPSFEFANGGFEPAHKLLSKTAPGFSLGMLADVRYETGRGLLENELEMVFNTEVGANLTITIKRD